MPTAAENAINSLVVLCQRTKAVDDEQTLRGLCTDYVSKQGLATLGPAATATAPASTAGQNLALLTNNEMFGDVTKVLGGPGGWLAITVSGVDKRIPYFDV